MIKKLHFKTMLLLCTMIMGIGSAWADPVTTIATGTFDGMNATYTDGWTTTGTGNGRTDCIVIGFDENITSPELNLSEYDEVTISIKARRYGSLADSKATIDASIDGESVGTTEATGTNASTSLADITFEPTAEMTAVSLVFTCTNATSAGSTHGAGINSITITGKKSTNAVLTGIALSGDYETTFPQNGTFSYEGLIVTASYDDGTSYAVTGYEVSTPDMTTLGTQTVTVSYTENNVTKTATYNITIEEARDYAELPFSWAGGSSADLVKVNGVTAYGLGNDYSSTNTPYLVKFDTTGDYIQVKTDSQPGKVTVGVKMLGGAETSTITVQGSADGETFTDVETLTISGSKNDVLVLETTKAFAATDRYVRLYFTKGSNVGVGPITIALPSTDPAISADATLSLAADATSGVISYSIINPVDGASLTATSEADWISDFTVASDKVTFVTTANTGDERTATVTLTYATATMDVTVTQEAYVDPNAPGTANNPYTVAQAIAATPSSGTTDNVYISGVVSSFYKDNIMGDGTNYRYYISDDGTTTTQLLVYKGKGLNNATFSDVDDLLVGDEVVICGKLTMYQNAPEVASGNYIVSLNRPVVTTPTITVAPATVSVDAEESEGTLAVTYENLTITDADEFDVLYYDADGEEISEPDWIAAEVVGSNDGYEVSYIVEANEGDARTAYFKVAALADNDFVYSNLVTVTQAKYVAPVNPTTYTLATSVTSGKHYVIASGETDIEGRVKVMAGQNNNNRGAVDGTVSGTTLSVSSGATEFVIYGPDADGYYAIYDAANGYLYAASGSSNHLKSQQTNNVNGKWSISFGNEGVSVVAHRPNGRNVMQYNATNDVFSCYASASQQPVYLYEKDDEAAPTETVHITDAKYATYCSKNALDFSNTGLTAYIAKMNGSIVSFEPVTKVPAYSGVLLQADAAGDVTVGVATTVDDVTGNAFIGVIEATKISEPGIFVLLNEEEGVGFYRTNNAFTVGARTAYLPALAGGSRNFIGLNETTGISDVNRETITNNRYFDLQGRSVAQPTKGLYIVNGKKVVVK